MHQIQSFFIKWINGLYTVAFAFIVAGIVLFLIPLPILKGALGPTIGGALVGAGFTILVTSITAQRAIFEQYKKEANLQRKTDVYGPLHSELKVLRKAFDEVRAGRVQNPQYINIHGDSFQPSLVFTTYNPLTFAWWPQFKENYHIDDFTSDAQERLNEVQSCLEAYNVMMQTARKTVQAMLQRHIAASIEKEEQRSDYQKWLQGGLGGSYTDEIRWFDFIKLQRAADSPDMPLGKGLSQQWAPKVEWLLVGKADQAAQEIYNTDARQWGAPNGIEFSWFKDIFDVAQADLKSEPVYEQVILAQEELFKRLQDAELMLAEGLRHIRDRYEGGVPLYKNSNRNSRLLTVSRSSSGLSFPQNMWKTPTLGITLILYALPFVNQRSFACIFASGFCIIDPTIILYHSASEIEGVNV